MQTRREFLTQSAAATAILTMPVAACSQNDTDSYAETTARLRAALTTSPDLRALVRFATLAPNGHNTQPWRFALRTDGVSILPDLSRRTSVVDPDDHHLYVSLGCAAENLLIAGKAHGLPGAVQFDDSAEGRIDIDFTRASTTTQGAEKRHDTLYEAIPKRQSTRSEYSGRAVLTDDLKRLERAANLEGVSMILITDAAGRKAVGDYVIEGNSLQMDNPAFIRELRDWIRFNPAEALRTGDGLFSACTGNPSVPSWLGKRMFSLVFRKDAENEKYARQLRSSAGVAVFTGAREDKSSWVQVGRSFQRFALQATALGMRHAHINQPIEEPSVRTRFASALGIGKARPDLVVRFGYAPPLPMSMRRPVDDVITA